MNRRALVQAGIVTGAAALAGCARPDEPAIDDEDDDPEADAEDDAEDEENGPLRIATEGAMLEGEEPVGLWISEAFEEAYPDAEVDWTVPEAGLDHYARRVELDEEVDADVFVGLHTGDLARLDESLDGDSLFDPIDHERLEAIDDDIEEFELDDPRDRTVPISSRCVSVIYDDGAIEDTPTLDTLREEPYAEDLVVQHPEHTPTGFGFLCSTIQTYGTGDDGWVSYWNDLTDHGVRLRETEGEAREEHADGDTSILIAPAADRAVAAVEGRDLDRYAVTFPDETAYVESTGAAIFRDTARSELAYTFLDFLLSDAVQTEFALVGEGRPVVSLDDLSLPDAYEEELPEPEETTSMSYDELRGNVTRWIGQWEQLFDLDVTSSFVD